MGLHSFPWEIPQVKEIIPQYINPKQEYPQMADMTHLADGPLSDTPFSVTNVSFHPKNKPPIPHTTLFLKCPSDFNIALQLIGNYLSNNNK